MSYSQEVKEELISAINDSARISMAETAGYIRGSACIRMIGSGFVINLRRKSQEIGNRIVDNILKFAAENKDAKCKDTGASDVAGRITEGVFEYDGLLVIRDELGKRAIKELRVGFDGSGTVPQFRRPSVSTAQDVRAYLRGLFLGGGSVNDPNKGYHLELTATDISVLEQAGEMLEKFDISIKIIQRKNRFVGYVKSGDSIADFMKLIGAGHAAIRFEDALVNKIKRNDLNRANNCFDANVQKYIDLKIKQQKNVKLIKEKMGLSALPDNLREVAEILADDDCDINSLAELGASLNPPIGKSGVNHRIRRIAEIADELK